MAEFPRLRQIYLNDDTLDDEAIKKEVVQGCAAMRMTWAANPAFHDRIFPSFDDNDWDDAIAQACQQLRDAKANKGAAGESDADDE